MDNYQKSRLKRLRATGRVENRQEIYRSGAMLYNNRYRLFQVA